LYPSDAPTTQIWSVSCRDNADFLQCPKSRSGDLIFSLQGLFTNVSLCARFQVSVSSSCDLWHHLMLQTDRPTDRWFLYRS